uniref:hypothetical protein n=1 Tax=Bradyrhizobium sp. 33ap4 TaxID=3061630 RepID=UPI002931AEA4
MQWLILHWAQNGRRLVVTFAPNKLQSFIRLRIKNAFFSGCFIAHLFLLARDSLSTDTNFATLKPAKPAVNIFGLEAQGGYISPMELGRDVRRMDSRRHEGPELPQRPPRLQRERSRSPVDRRSHSAGQEGGDRAGAPNDKPLDN